MSNECAWPVKLAFYQVRPEGSFAPLAEIPQSQALLKEGALLQPAKHLLLPDSQYLWQVTSVQQKKFGSHEAHQNSRAIIPLTEAKAKPLHSALRTDHACSRLSPEELRRIHVEGRPVKATNRGQPGRRLSNSTQLTFSGVFTATSMRLVPRPECGKNIQTTTLANKPKNKKSSHTSGPGNNQTTWTNGRNSNGRRESGTQAGEKAGMNQPVVHPLDGTTNGKDPWWPKVAVPRGKKKNFLRPGNMNRSHHQSRDYKPAGVGVPPSTPLLPSQGPRTGWHVTAPTGSLQPRVASAQLMLPLPLVPVAFADKAVLCPLLASRQRRLDPVYLPAPPRTRCFDRPLMQDRLISPCNLNLGEPA